MTVCFIGNFSLTRGISRVRKMREEENRLNGFSWPRSFIALKRGVNEMDFYRAMTVYFACFVVKNNLSE
jgi:hypothetical protein